MQTFKQMELTLDEMAIVIRGLEWAIKDLNHPVGIRNQMGDLQKRLLAYNIELVSQLDLF